jgi:hypothetical protein
MITPNLKIRSYAVKARYGFGGLSFRFLTAVDVESFSRRSTSEQAKIQDDLEYAMSEAAARASLDRRRWYRQPCGDGELAVLPAGTDGLSVVADYPRMLALILSEISRSSDLEPRLRVRMAIHHGAVSLGPLGPVGPAPIAVSRLVDAQVLRQELRQRNDLDVALIVSATVYDEIVQSRFHGLDPEAFSRTTLKVKGTTFTGYLYKNGLTAQHPEIPIARSAEHERTVDPTTG